MVGVPGRSKGCVTCRRRKKGCDKNVPSCHQCIRSGLQCGGYGRDLVWVNTTPDGDDAGKAMPQPPHGKSSSGQQRPWSVIYTTKTANINNTTTVALHDSLARSAREELFFGMLISTALPYGHLLSAKASDISTNGWVSAVEEYYNREPAIRYAALAMSVGFMGVEDRRKQVTQHSQLALQGLEAYNKAIREMVKALRDTSRSKKDGVIVAARILQFYETFFGKAPDWRAHIEGQLALFLARGPESFVSGQAHQLYVDGRVLIVMLSIGRRVKSPLHTPEWRSVPWRVIPKSIKDKLMDIMEDIPFMLVSYDNLRACRDPDRADELRQIVMVNCKHISSCLDVWEKEAGSDLYQFDYTLAGSPLPVPKDDTEFGIVYISAVYWGARLILYSTLGLTLTHSVAAMSPGSNSVPSLGSSPASSAATVSTPASSPGQSSAKSPGPPDGGAPPIRMENPGIYARKIAHMVHLLYEPAAGAMQGTSGLFPLALALRYFATTEPPGQRSPESQMIYNLYNKPFMGSFVGRFLADLQGPQQSDEAKRDSEAKAQRNIFWYAVLGSENILRVGS
ncbi:zn2-c6 fungal-type dna-binding domain [Trichoderma arundinaceum]|uniref:Zn2-c6 fungal-type dna-binding domain n=1 Tax=Trichoderma arundinaceum TaxID=490622 RepID=A0A395NJ19_TRIAR|nr:zn2-c6 fungal-type dna-binding domain [Trichoderma arundinaceum]